VQLLSVLSGTSFQSARSHAGGFFIDQNAHRMAVSGMIAIGIMAIELAECDQPVPALPGDKGIL
jgi:hypothetical protein